MGQWTEPGIKNRMLSVTPRLLAGEEGRTEDSDIVYLEDNISECSDLPIFKTAFKQAAKREGNPDGALRCPTVTSVTLGNNEGWQVISY